PRFSFPGPPWITTALARIPCLRAFNRLRCLPAGVRGPVDLSAFWRFASSFFTETNLGGEAESSGTGVLSWGCTGSFVISSLLVECLAWVEIRSALSWARLVGWQPLALS